MGIQRVWILGPIHRLARSQNAVLVRLPNSATINGTADASIPGQRNGNKPDTLKTDQYKFQYDQDDYRGNVTIIESPTGFTRYFYETADSAAAGIGQLVQVQENPKIIGAGAVDAGGPEYEVNTYYQRREDGRVWRSQTVRGNPDSYPSIESDQEPTRSSDLAERDAIERFSYNSNGYLLNSIGVTGLTTSYTYNTTDHPRRIETIQVTDQLSNLATKSWYAYDPQGFIKNVTTKNLANVQLKVRDADYDAIGNLKSESLQSYDQNQAAFDASKNKYEYNALGQVTKRDVGKETNLVKFEKTYNKAGQVTSAKKAVGSFYRSIYTGTNLSVEQTTNYLYYSDGTLKQTESPGAILTRNYVGPANYKSWEVIDKVSTKEHAIAPSGAITFGTTGFSTTETTTDKYGRVLAIHNLLTGAESNYQYNDIRVDLPSKITDKVNLGWDANQWQIPDVINTIKYDSAGNRLSNIEDGRRQTVNQYDPSGELISTATIGIGQRSARGMEREYRHDPAGVVFQTINKSHNWVEALFTYNYDQSTRLWKSTDALTGSEPGTVPATTLLQYDGPLLKAEITDRNGTKSFQWTNSLGQVVKSLSPLGAWSSFEYDVFGNRIFERFTPAYNDTISVRETTYHFDPLGRLRSVDQNGLANASGGTALTLHTATDYFDPNTPDAHGWNVVQFQPFEQETNAKALATKIRLDSIGNPIYIQQADPDILSDGTTVTPQTDNTPATLITYSYDAVNRMVVTTSRLSVAANGGANIAKSYPETRINRTAVNSNGNSLMVLSRMSDREETDMVVSNTLIDSGFVVQSRNFYDGLGSLKSQAAPVGTVADPNAAFETTTYINDDLGRVVEVTDPAGKVSTIEYDRSGNVIKTEDSKGQTSRTAYDFLNRPVANLSLAIGLSVPDAHDTVLAEWEYQGKSTKYKNRNGWETTTTVNPSSRTISKRSVLGQDTHEETTELRSDGAIGSSSDAWNANSSRGSFDLRNGFNSAFQVVYDALGRSTDTVAWFNANSGNSATVIESPKIKEHANLLSSGRASSKTVTLLNSGNSTKILDQSNIFDGLGRVTSLTQTFDPSSTQAWASGFTPRDKQVTYSYNIDGIKSSQRSEKVDSTFTNTATANYAYDSVGRPIRANYALADNLVIVGNDYSSNNRISDVVRQILRDSTPGIDLNEAIHLTYNTSGELQSQVSTYKQVAGSNTTQPGPVVVRPPQFNTVPGGRVTEDFQFNYKYDAEGNMVERSAKFQPVTYDDQDTAHVTLASNYGFDPEVGMYPTYNPQQQFGGAGLNDVSAQVRFGDSPPLQPREYDLWITWKPRNDLGTGHVTVKVKDDFTEANPQTLFGIEGWGWGMVTNPATGMLERAAVPAQKDSIPIVFATQPRYLHTDGLRWFHVGTVHLDSPGAVKMKIEDDLGAIAFDAFKITPHVAKEVIDYDYANRSVHSTVYSELGSDYPPQYNPTQADEARMETFYAYDVTGHMVAVRNVDRFAAGTGNNLQYIQESSSTVGYAYQGAQQILGFGLDTNKPDFLKIKSFNLIGVQGDVLAVDSTVPPPPPTPNTQQPTSWQFNNLDGTKFVDSKGWFPSDYAFAGQKLQSASSDFLMQSRDASRNTWHGGLVYQPGGFVDAFANTSDAVLIGGTIVASIPLALGIVATAPISVPTLSVGGTVFFAGGALSGGAANATSEYLRGGNGMSIFAAATGGAGWSALNPLSGYTSLGGGLIGAGIAKFNGSSAAEGFQWGEIAGGYVGGGVQHYGRALAKYTAGGNGAKAAGMALRHTAAAMGFEGAGIGIGAGVGGYYGGSSGALMGAQIGQLAGGLAANFAVACFTAGTPLVVDMDGNSRPIDEIEVGDFVLARSEFDPDGPLGLKQVEEKFVRTAVVMELVVRGQSIKTTAEHPFFVPAQQAFVPAGQLRAGDQLISHDGELISIESVSSTDEVTTVYNLRVADHHTYFVGGSMWGFDVWVHNAIYAPVSVLDNAAKAQGKVVGSFKIDLTNPPPQGWRYWTTPYSPKFANPRIVDPATGLKVPTNALGSKTGLHELQHFLDATQHPQLYYFARASNAPGAGLAHFVFETRGYLQSHGLKALFNPSLAMASVRHAGRAHLVYRDLAGLAGLGALGAFSYWFTSSESGQQ